MMRRLHVSVHVPGQWGTLRVGLGGPGWVPQLWPFSLLLRGLTSVAGGDLVLSQQAAHHAEAARAEAEARAKEEAAQAAMEAAAGEAQQQQG